jgi:peptidoglycan hydrolase FlgJ
MDALLPSTQAALRMPNAPASAGSAQLWQSARDFEATALNELFEPMFDTVDMSNSMFGGGDAENSWKPVFVQEMTKAIAAKGGLGIATPVYNTLLQMQEKSQHKGNGR